MNCDECRHYNWYYDRCQKWNCEVDARSVHNCFEARETPIKDRMTNFKFKMEGERYHERT